METGKIRQAILNKAQEEADQVVNDAEAKAKEIIEKAKTQQVHKLEVEQKKIITDAHREASKILAQASLEARKGILQEKERLINEVISRVKKELSLKVSDKKSMLLLIKEAIEAFGSPGKISIHVSSKDSTIAREVIAENNELKEKIAEVKEIECIGGILAESSDGMVSIDNAFETRIEMLLPKILPEIARKLFGADNN